MKWLHRIDELANTFGHSSPLMINCLMIMLDNIKEVKTTQSSKFDNYKDIIEGLPTNHHNNGIYSNYTENKQVNGFFEEYEKTLI